MTQVVAAAYANRFTKAVNYTPTASLTTPTYDSSGVTTEPTWILKPSWVTATGTDLLAHNPLTGGSSSVENPSLLISNDSGSTWTTPAGLTNPISPAPGTGSNADCHLLADPNTNQLIMTWTVTGRLGNLNGIFYSICTDATLVTWSAVAPLLRVNVDTGFSQSEQESKLVWDRVRGKYLLFTQHQGAPNSIKVRIASSSNPVGTYGLPIDCVLSIPGNETPWHMDVIQEASGRFIMTFCDNHNPGTLSRQGWIATSWDGITWKCAPRPFMKANAWTAFGVYRPSLQPARSGAGYDCIVARVQTPDSRLGIVRNIPATEIP